VIRPVRRELPPDYGLLRVNLPTGGETPMSLTLTDLAAAVADYVRQKVAVEVSEVTHGSSSVLQPHERDRFTVTLTNATDGVRLVNIVYDLSIDPDSVAVLHGFGSALMPSREGFDLRLPLLQEDQEVSRLVVWPNERTGLATLDPGQVIKFDDFSVQTKKIGDATIKCHIYATVDQASLFPQDQPGSTVKRTLKVQ
jgi:hypothetical protein